MGGKSGWRWRREQDEDGRISMRIWASGGAACRVNSAEDDRELGDGDGLHRKFGRGRSGNSASDGEARVR